ncbi:MAG: hypothetical protein HKM94_00845 [Halobacteria archaeon]|nr:hypothetical protein [Halobacteria archaeon]
MTICLDKAKLVAWLEEQIEHCEQEAEKARQLITSEHSGQTIPAEECYARQYEKLAENYRLLGYKHIIEDGRFDVRHDE